MPCVLPHTGYAVLEQIVNWRERESQVNRQTVWGKECWVVEHNSFGGQ